MRKKINVLLLLAFLILTSCGKEITTEAPEFLGFWEGKKDNVAYTIRIDDDGHGRYSSVGNGEMDAAEGSARINNNTLRIGLRRLTIDKHPEETNGNWEMTVNGIIYSRIPEHEGGE